MPPESPLKTLERLDAELLKLVNDCNSSALNDGALSRKHKLLIAMALDAAHGTADGVRSLAQQALRVGATKDEVMEALRVAFYISGAGAVYTAARALGEVFPQ
ncbi:MAG: carboxymuconolactone decarboxylase family protein [Chloroflexi bacterium]|nr:carboxymuconolactone decarboxylase family protein [Chloroflexota bacterium]